MLGFQSVLQGLQASKLQMGNSLRRLLIREGWKSLIPDQIGHPRDLYLRAFAAIGIQIKYLQFQSQPQTSPGISNL